MVQIKNPDGSPGCFVGKDVDISRAVITSTPDSKIVGSTKLTGKFDICSTQIVDSVIEAKTMAKIESTEITDSTITVDTSDISGSKIDESKISISTLEVKDSCFQFVAMDGVGKMVVKATQSKIIGLNKIDTITMGFFKTADFTVTDSTIRGVMAFYLKDGRTEISGSNIEGKRITDTLFPVARSNVFVEESFLMFKDSTLCEAKHAQILAINTTGLRHSLKISQSKISSTVYCGGKIDNSEINSPIMSKLTVDIKDCLFEKNAVIKTKNAKVRFLNAKVEGNASILASNCPSVEITGSTISDNSVVTLTEVCKIKNTTIKENAKLTDVNSKGTVFCGNSVSYGIYFIDCYVSGFAHVGVTQNDEPLKNAKFVALNGRDILNAKDLVFIQFERQIWEISQHSPLVVWNATGCYSVNKEELMTEIGYLSVGEKFAALKGVDMSKVLKASQEYWQKKYKQLSQKIVCEILMVYCWRMQKDLFSEQVSKEAKAFFEKLSTSFCFDIKNKKISHKAAIMSCPLLNWLYEMEGKK